MFYLGTIKELNKIVVSDPSYGPDVSCRYENSLIHDGKNWRVSIALNEISEKHGYDGLTMDVEGIDFSLMLNHPIFSGCRLHPSGQSFSHPSKAVIMEYEIGMDTACVALGINEIADEILASQDEWQPGCALKTLTDGLFGNVVEVSVKGQPVVIFISGYLDADAGYSIEDILQYLSSTFEITDLYRETSLDEKISSAKEQDSNSGRDNCVPEKESDLEI